jgi:HAD domain in Swiss Army Knife RNA repair proteins
MKAQWMHIFMQRDLSVKHLECLPEHSTGRKRKDEILDWFNQHTHNDPFVIIDDDKSLHELPTSLKERWIETSPYIGLTPEFVEGIIKS